jgi:hypothetical protein
MAKYKLTENGVQDTETGAFIPNDTGNRHWQEYLVWAESNTADPEFTTQEIEDNAWTALRGQRGMLLSRTDFMMTTDFYASMTTQEQTDVTAYRLALRDLPSNTVDPTDVTWPTKPQIVIDHNV